MRTKLAAIRLLAALALGIFTLGAGQAGEPAQIVSESEARNIAWNAGLVHVEEITRGDDHWEIAGRDSDDNEMVLDIDLRNGRILD